MKKRKNITKRIAALGLASVLIANSLPVTAFAVETGNPESTVVTEEEQPEGGREIITDLPEPDVTVTDEEVAAADISEDTHIEEKIQAGNIEKEESAGDANTMSFAELQAQIDSAANGDTIKLEKDVNWKESYPSALGDDSNPLIIPSGKTVTLDLNGHTIDRRLKNNSFADNGNVITVSGNLTLTDSSTDSTGKLTGGNTSGSGGGGVCIDENGTFTMEGGSITDCTATSPGGGVYVNGGTFTMNGGTISSCNATNSSGGGVCVYSGTFTMNGGTISGCTGRGVFVDSSGTFTMSGGARIDGCTNASGGGVYVNGGTFTMNGSARITGCTATNGDDDAQGGGGVYLFDGTFNVSGSPVISGNKKGDKTNNVTLYGSKTITVTGALTDGAEIRVSGANGKVIAKPGTGYTLTADDVAKLHSDDTSLDPVLENGEIKLATAWGALQARLSAGGEITLTRDYVSETTDTGLEVPSGKNAILDLNDHYILYKGTVSASVITVNGSLTLKDSKTTGRTTRYVTLTEGRATSVSESNTSGAIEVTGGFIAGGNNESNNGGGVYVENSCMFTMEGGTIVGCKAVYGGGVNVNNSGKFNMEGGSITDCTADSGGGVNVNNTGNFYMNGGGITNCTAIDSGNKWGGGVLIFSSGNFNMEGGSITDCTADSGGGVFIFSTGNFKMNGGSITDCTATSQGGGVYVYSGTFKICGAPVIRDNKKGSDANNVALNSNKTITVTGALTDGAEIRVSGANGKVIAKPDTGYTITAADVEKFHSDDTSLDPVLDSGNVVLKATLPTATLSNPSMVYNGSAFSPTISFEGAPLTKDSDYTLSYKKVVNTDETALSGAPKDAGSYKLVVAGKGSYAGKQELPFTITKKPVTVSGITVKDKIYDGGTTAELITTGAVFEGKCDGDTLTVSDAGAGTFADKDAGEATTVNIDATKFVLGGASAGNYKLADGGHQSTAAGRISKKSITITGVTANDKEYDGNTTATTNTSHATVTGLVGADTVEFTVDGTFADANKGNNKTVTLSNWNLTSGGTNYEIDSANSQTTTTASITGVQVYIDGVSAQNKVYDGNKTATVTGTAILKRVNGNDTVSALTVSDITAEFEDKNAGDNKAVTITGGTLSDAENYTLVPGKTTGLTANISKASRKNEVIPNQTKYGLSGTVDISDYIEEGCAVSGNMTVSGNSEIFDGEPQLKGKSISYKLKDVSGNVGERADITAKVSGTNYKDYKITVSVEVINCDHPTVELKNVIEADCSTVGYTGDYVCTVCGYIVEAGHFTQKDPDNHDFDGGVEVKPSTTITKGETKYTCRRCHKEKIVADIPCKEEEGKDYEDLRKDIEDLSGNAAPSVETKDDGKGNEVTTISINGTQVEEVVKDQESGKETVKSVVWIGGLKDSYRYTGSAIKPSFHVYDGTRKLKENTDYKVKWTKNKKVGTAEITVKFKGNYKDTKSESVKFEIKPAILGEDIIAHETGVAVKKSAQKPVPVLTWKETGKTVPAKNFNVVYDPSEVKSAGTYAATITSKNTNFDGTTTALVKVSAKDKVLSNVKVKFDPKSYNCTGKPIEPKYSLTMGSTTLTKDKDYRQVSLTGNTNPGTATIIFEAISGNEAGYVGSKTAAFKVSGKKSLKDESIIITCAESAPYAKGGAKAAVVVTDKDTGSALKEGVDYTLSYSKNKAVGTGAEVKVKGKGNYKDTVAKTFTVTKQSLKALEGNIIVSDQFTTRSKLKAPKVTIIDIDGKKLSAKTDYTVGDPDLSEKGNTEDSGIVYITIAGKGNYSETESVKVSYHYMKTVSSNIGKAKAKTIPSQAYTGNAVKLSKADLTNIVYTGSKGAENYLKPGTDFTVISSCYSNNVKKGTAKVTIRGIGAYAGTKTLSFKIEQRKVDYKGALVGDAWK